VHRPSVSPARLEAVQAVRDRLDAAGVPCSALVRARDDARRAQAGDRLVEVERFIAHDGAMNAGAGWPAGSRFWAAFMACSPGSKSPTRAVEFVNHIEPGTVLPGTRAGAARIRSWHPTPEERRMASQAEQLAELVTVGEAGLAAGLARQLTHGDFWDDNVFFRGEAVVFVADFGFLAERARIDDLAHPVLRRYRVRPHRPGPDRGPAAAGSRLHNRPGQPPHACRASGAAVGYRPPVAPAPRRPEGHASPGSPNRWPGPAATGQKPSARSPAGC
jgi:hypothetical protein